MPFVRHTRAIAAALAALAFAAPAVARADAPPPAAACALADADRAWLDRAVRAWRMASREIAGIGEIPAFEAVFFDSGCVLRSRDALTTAGDRTPTWRAETHAGVVTAPDGNQVPAGVISFTSGSDGLAFFLMSTPAVWRANGVDGAGSPLEDLMVAVMLHEASHVSQIGPYGPRLGALIERHSLPDDFSDDSMQHRFKTEAAFAGSVRRETELLLAASVAADDVEARRLAAEARAMMKARAQRWYVGEDVHFGEAESIWLTFEGAGQWLAYQWMVHPRGGGRTPAQAAPAFNRPNHWWSQTQGFALVCALDRIMGPSWKRHAFGDGAMTAQEMLDAALAEGTATLPEGRGRGAACVG